MKSIHMTLGAVAVSTALALPISADEAPPGVDVNPGTEHGEGESTPADEVSPPGLSGAVPPPPGTIVSADTPVPVYVHDVGDGEDPGIPADVLEDRSNWYLGKVEPAVSAKVADGADIDVIIYLVGDDPADTIDQIQAQHRDAISAAAAQVQSLADTRMPQRSLNDEEERQFMENLGSASPLDPAVVDAAAEALDSALDAMRAEVDAAFNAANSDQRAAVTAAIESGGGEVNHVITMINALGARVPAAQIHVLAADDRVGSIMFDTPKELELNVSVPSVGFQWWTSAPSPINGRPYDFGIPEGVRTNHPAFSSSTLNARPGSTASDHGTHVTGIVVSDDSTYEGGAPGVDVYWAETGGGQSATMSDMQWMAITAEATNHSLGYGTISTDYNTNDAFYDAYVRAYDNMVTKSAGNGGWGNASTTTMTHPSTAYNLMSVASMNDRGTTTRSDDFRSSFSSTGPTPGGRKKPDITAPGSFIRSANWNWATPGVSDFVDKSGTSMAAPHVAAAIILQTDGGNFDSKAQKAVLLNTADAWDSQNSSSTADDTMVLGSHWDKSYGWGYLDMEEAHFNRSDYFTGTVIPRNDNATADDYKLFTGVMFANEKATLVWEKRHAGYNNGGPPTTSYPLSDLNIRLYQESDGSQVDSSLDGRDNVEQVAWSGSTGDSVIKVYSWSTGFTGSASEPFALATEENFSEAAPPAPGLTSPSMPSSVSPGQTFTVSTVLSNGSADVAMHDSSVTLTLPAGFSLASGTATKTVATVNASGSTTLQWSVVAGTNPGSFVLGINGSSNSYDETYIPGPTSGSITVANVGPGQVALVSPSGTTSNTTPTFTWNADPDATWYYLWVNNNGPNAYKRWYSATAAGCAAGTGTCSVTPPNVLSAGTVRWWVAAWNSAGYGAWSASMDFTITAGVPSAATLVSPSGSSATNTPTFTWNAVPGSTWYYLWVNQNGSLAYKTWYTASAAGCASGTGTCSINPGTSLSGNIVWWIQTWNSAGTGPWSSSLSFTISGGNVPGAAILSSPVGGMVGSNTPAYTWAAVSGATSYYLWVDAPGGVQIRNWYTAAQAGCAGGGTCSVTPATSVSGSPVEWWIRTWNSNGNGPWSAMASFSAP